MSALAHARSGAVFATPLAPHWGVSTTGEQRLVALTLTNGEQRHYDDVLVPDYAPGAIDLSMVRSGRCPMLVEHRHTFGDLLGSVVDAWLEGSTLCCIGRLAHGGEADRVWELLTQGFPLSLSGGYTVQDAEQAGPSPYGGVRLIARRWRLAEISVVVTGKDHDAFARVLRDDEVAAMIARAAKASSDERRLSVHALLHLPRWNAWAPEAAGRMADELGVDQARMSALLADEVASHACRLLNDIAA